MLLEIQEAVGDRSARMDLVGLSGCDDASTGQAEMLPLPVVAIRLSRFPSCGSSSRTVTSTTSIW